MKPGLTCWRNGRRQATNSHWTICSNSTGVDHRHFSHTCHVAPQIACGPSPGGLFASGSRQSRMLSHRLSGHGAPIPYRSSTPIPILVHEQAINSRYHPPMSVKQNLVTDRARRISSTFLKIHKRRGSAMAFVRAAPSRAAECQWLRRHRRQRLINNMLMSR